VGFFSAALGVKCTLARFPPDSADRNFKPHLANESAPANSPKILLSNESPILIINSLSVSSLNSAIAAHNGKPALADVFRANIVLRAEEAYAEDSWSSLRIGEEVLQLLGGCRRCHMVCIDQETAEKDEEPFVTLSKERRRDGKVWFGMHAYHAGGSGEAMIRVGDGVEVCGRVQERETGGECKVKRVERVTEKVTSTPPPLIRL
jgi:molybdenum cofactor sulfurtransferase